jgi:hypothetical protein
VGERMFPVLWGGDRKRYEALGIPREVPWAMLAPHEAQAIANHSQRLQRLAERGGLGVDEMVLVLEGRSIAELFRQRPPLETYWERLRKHLEAHATTPHPPTAVQPDPEESGPHG